MTPLEAQEWLGVLAYALLLVGVTTTVIVQLRIYYTLRITQATMDKVVENTNGMSHRLEQLAGDAGEARGRASARRGRE